MQPIVCEGSYSVERVFERENETSFPFIFEEKNQNQLLFHLFYVRFCEYLSIMKSPEEFYIYSYTPISDPDAKGYFDLMIKV